MAVYGNCILESNVYSNTSFESIIESMDKDFLIQNVTDELANYSSMLESSSIEVVNEKVSLKNIWQTIKKIIKSIIDGIGKIIGKIKEFILKNKKNKKQKEIINDINNVSKELKIDKVVIDSNDKDKFKNDFNKNINIDFEAKKAKMQKEFDDFNKKAEQMRNKAKANNKSEESPEEYNDITIPESKKNIDKEMDEIKEKYDNSYSSFSKLLVNNFTGITKTCRKYYLTKYGDELIKYERSLISKWKDDYFDNLGKQYDAEQASHDKVLEAFQSRLYDICSNKYIYFDCNNYIDSSKISKLLSITPNEDLSNFDQFKNNSIIKKDIFVNKQYAPNWTYDLDNYEWKEDFATSSGEETPASYGSSWGGKDKEFIQQVINNHISSFSGGKTVSECLDQITKAIENDQLSYLNNVLEKYQDMAKKISNMMQKLDKEYEEFGKIGHSYGKAVDYSDQIKKYNGFLRFTKANISIIATLTEFSIKCTNAAKNASTELNSVIAEMIEKGYVNAKSVSVINNFNYIFKYDPRKDK